MKPPSAESKALNSRILELLRAPSYRPLDKVDISKALRLPAERRAELRGLLREMEERGEIARIRKDRYVLPETADLVTGVLQVHQRGNAHLIGERPGQADIFVSAENTWTALDGDRVVARIIDEGIVDQRRRAPSRSGPRVEARVIRILRRAHETIVGTLQRSNKFFYVIPDSPRMVHNVYVHPGAVALPRQAEVGDKVVVKLDPWESRHVNPEGEITEVLGAATDPGVDMLSILRKYHLPEEFPAAVMKEAERISETIEEAEIGRREDLRGQMIVTIDPDDAKDFDDAIFVEKLPAGWRVGIHIADVSHYVKPGGAMDREAWERGNSVYLVDRVIPMLPEKLSNGICSLKPNVDRLAKSVFIEFNKSGNIKSARFGSSVIRSAARLTYKEAFALLSGEARTPLGERLHTAWELASLLRKKRFEAGSLELDFPEVKVILDADKKPVRMEKIENDISHQLVEEFMLAANEVVARELKNRLIPAVYRVHEDPDAAKLAEFREFAASYEYRVGDLTLRKEVQRFLSIIRGKPEEYALKIGFLKSLKRATYGTEPLGHYGLAKVNYTHFTSPIRRYADLVVHRALEGMIGEEGGRRGRTSVASLTATAEHISLTERTATDAERESVKMKKIEFFQGQLKLKTPDVFKAVVLDVRSYGLLIELPNFLMTGLVHVSALVDDFYSFDSVRLRYVGRKTKKIYGIGNDLEVVVARVDTYKQQIDFRPPEPAKNPSAERNFQAQTRRRRGRRG